ncbi:MAG: hypothetical protein VB858_07330 [Planctomycetaceae bacterium]
MSARIQFLLLFTAVALSGCGRDTQPAEPTSETETATHDVRAGSDAGIEPVQPRPRYSPVQIGSSEEPGRQGDSGSSASTQPHNINDVIAALKPLQIVMGKWNGVLKSGGIPETHDWVWDLTSDKKFPALSLRVTNGNFFSSARITYEPSSTRYRMTTVDAEGIAREFQGNWEAAPAEVPGDDGKTLHRTFKLKLTEIANADLPNRWEYVFSQQNNNRYQVFASRARGSSSRFIQRDVIGSQRSGTTFAQADDDYGERTCIISQGLGTIQVSYQGKSYYVCCTGCRAAFEDDPQMWIARWEEMQAEKQNSQ